MYKIFHENKTLVFPNIESDELKSGATIQESDTYDIEDLCIFLPEWLDDTDPTQTLIQQVSPVAVGEALRKTFRLAPAAGGIVVSGDKFVGITRKGIPDLPKGHIEAGETPEAAALREVEEETGIGKLKIERELPSTWHCYLRGETWELKRTYWYVMTTDEPLLPHPQQEEGITEVNLVGKDNVEAFLEGTFLSIREVLGPEILKIIKI